MRWSTQGYSVKAVEEETSRRLLPPFFKYCVWISAAYCASAVEKKITSKRVAIKHRHHQSTICNYGAGNQCQWAITASVCFCRGCHLTILGIYSPAATNYRNNPPFRCNAEFRELKYGFSGIAATSWKIAKSRTGAEQWTLAFATLSTSFPLQDNLGGGLTLPCQGEWN